MLQMCIMKNANLAEHPGKTIQRTIFKPKRNKISPKSNEMIWHIVQLKTTKEHTSLGTAPFHIIPTTCAPASIQIQTSE